MTSSPANWTALFNSSDTQAISEEGVDIIIDEDEITEDTGEGLMAMPSAEDMQDDPIFEYEDVTDDLVPIDGLAASEASHDEEEEEEEPRKGSWPRSFEYHLRHIKRATRDEESAKALDIFGLGDASGCEHAVAAIAKTWEDLRFWEPMLELGRAGDFSGHLGDLRGCMKLLEDNSPPADRPQLLERWEQTRAELRRNLPAAQNASLSDLQWAQNAS